VSTLKVNNLEDLGADPVVTNGVIEKAALPSGSILQVVSTTKTDIFTMSSSTFAAVTGYSATITPSSATSKILILADLFLNNRSDAQSQMRLLRDSTVIGSGDAAGSRITAFSGENGNIAAAAGVAGGTFLDSPATTSAITYSAQIRVNTGTVGVNTSLNDSDSSNNFRSSSTITLMEVAG